MAKTKQNAIDFPFYRIMWHNTTLVFWEYPKRLSRLCHCFESAVTWKYFYIRYAASSEASSAAFLV